MISTYNVAMALGDSSKMTGCTASGRYLKDHVCVLCEGDDEFVDYQGINCLRSCSEGKYIFVDRNLKICHEGMTCDNRVVANLVDSKWTLTCGSCPAAQPFTLDTSIFCIYSCRTYSNSSGCVNNNVGASKGLCKYSFVSEATCVEQCVGVTEYLITKNNDKVCGKACIGTVNEDPLSLAITCGVCSTSSLKQLGVFCVASCIGYYNAHCTTLATTDNTGECQRPIVEGDICIVATINNVVGMGDSKNFIGCSAGKYLKNFVCVACDQIGQWIDYQGFNCLTQCDDMDEIYAANGRSLCKTNMPTCIPTFKP